MIPRRLIFVCSGNICRSPMAERIFMARARQRGHKVMALSMGTLGIHGRSAPREAIEACREIGVELDGHASQGLSAGLLGHAGAILVMETKHRDAIIALDTGLADRTELLGSYAPDAATGGLEIDDPIGQPIEVYRACRDRIVRCVDAFLDRHA